MIEIVKSKNTIAAPLQSNRDMGAYKTGGTGDKYGEAGA
jgi:hypothetical protein